MSKIFELFGHRLNDTSAEARYSRNNALCPFMQAKCDGGGNRYLSNINLARKPELRQVFNKLDNIASGVCSLQLHQNETPWIVCPRRLIYPLREQHKVDGYQARAIHHLWEIAGYQSPCQLGVWPELRISHRSEAKSFAYTFDYVIMSLQSLDQDAIIDLTGESWHRVRPNLVKAGYTIAQRGNTEFVEDFPSGEPLIVEVMTSSTSGGNKDKRSTIPMAVEDALLKDDHLAPGINYRQVWARMVSQLIVKSEVAIAWGGKTVWVLQDKLVDYISETTALNVHQFLAKNTDEVNILSLAYQENFESDSGVLELSSGDLFAGPISSTSQSQPSFQDMIRAPLLPSRAVLINAVTKRYPAMVHLLTP